MFQFQRELSHISASTYRTWLPTKLDLILLSTGFFAVSWPLWYRIISDRSSWPTYHQSWYGQIGLLDSLFPTIYFFNLIDSYPVTRLPTISLGSDLALTVLQINTSSDFTTVFWLFFDEKISLNKCLFVLDKMTKYTKHIWGVYLLVILKVDGLDVASKAVLMARRMSSWAVCSI